MFKDTSRKRAVLISLSLLLVFLSFPLMIEAQEKEETPSDINKERIAVLPFFDFSDDPTALKQVMPVIKTTLESKGFALMDDEGVAKTICNENMKLDSYVSREIAKKIKDNFLVNGILAGSIVSFSYTGDPHIGLLARLTDPSSGLVVWADYAFVSGEDFITILGLGKVKDMEKLIQKAVDRLFSSFSTASFRKERESTYRIAVIPFQNKSSFNGAGLAVMDMFIVELFRQGIFEPVEFGDVRKAMVDLRVRRKGEIDYKKMEALSNATGADTVLVGTVEQYSEEAGAGPVVTITARLLDARKNKILWYNSHQLNGEKKIIAFDWGETVPVDKVAYKAVSLLVNKMKAALSD